MPRSKRTTKTLAQRIDLSYFKRRHPFRWWRTVLAIAAPVVALLWLGGAAVANHKKMYSAGPVSHSHAVFGGRCELCHITRAGFFSQQVKDEKCLSCHDGPVHQEAQLFAPDCSSCHGEHRGGARLVSVADYDCARCHSDLRTNAGPAHYERMILNFDTSHPEFRALRPGFCDPGTIKLNHEVHMKAGLKGPHGPVQMRCDDCHRPANDRRAWPYAVPSMAAAKSVTVPASSMIPSGGTLPEWRSHGAAYMAPVTYALQCAGCHSLPFDAHISGNVPHDKPEVVHDFLVRTYSDYIRQHPSEVRSVWAPLQRIPQQLPVSLPRNADEWVQFRVGEAEILQWQKTCKECHTLQQQPNRLPIVANSGITQRWFQHANFDHRAHRLLDCTSCHTQALKSRETSDVLLPGIKICQQCHRSGRAQAEAAEGRCFECHSYHDWNKQKPIKDGYKLPQLMSKK